MSLHLIEPDLGRISGGAAFNRAVAEAAGPRIVLHSVPGSWDEPGPAESAAVNNLLAAVTGPDGLVGPGETTTSAPGTEPDEENR